MDFDTFSRRIVSRRLVVMGSLMALTLPLILGRLTYLQGLAGQKYKTLAEKNRVRVKLVQPVRGKLLDRNGTPLAQDEKVFRLVLTPEQCPNIPETLQKISSLIPLTSAQQEKIKEKAAKSRAFMPITIARSLSFKQLAVVQINLPDLPGVDFTAVPLRNYTLGQKLGHISGYVGHVPKEMEVPQNWMPEFPLGRRGLEKVYDEKLRGHAGLRHVEFNAYGREVRDIHRVPSAAGENLNLTLDSKIQQAAWEAMEGWVGSAVVIDVATGGIVAAVNRPGLNPSTFADGLSKEEWQGLLNDPEKPLINRALDGQYAPGSTIKPLVALAALEAGKANPRETITCHGHIKFGNRKFFCWDKHGKMNLHRAVAQSCDIYLYELGKRLGVDEMAKVYQQFGLGQQFDLGLPSQKGLVPTRAWKQKTHGEKWVGGEDLITAIGQGFMLATPLQLAVMSARLATGKAVMPTFLKPSTPVVFDKLDVKKEHLEFAQDAMKAVVQAWYGTAKSARNKGFETAGKTGTAQVISKRYEKNYPLHLRPYAERPHGLFVSFAPVSLPRYAVAVVLEHAGSGGGAAAPVAGKIMKALLA